MQTPFIVSIVSSGYEYQTEENLHGGYLRLNYLCNQYVCICEQVNLINKEMQIKWNGCYLGLLQLNAKWGETLN